MTIIENRIEWNSGVETLLGYWSSNSLTSNNAYLSTDCS